MHLIRKSIISRTFQTWLLCVVMFGSTPIIAQSSWGIGSELHTSSLTNMKLLQKTYNVIEINGVLTLIEADRHHKVVLRHDFSVSPVFYYRRQLKENFSFETGVGYTNIRYTLYFESEMSLPEPKLYYSSFHMALQYLHVPIKFQYRLPVNNKSSIHNWSGALGLKNRVLIDFDNNINDLHWGGYYIDLSFYSRYVASTELSLAYGLSIRNGQSVELYLFCNRDLTPFIKRSRAIDLNSFFYKMRGMQFGIGFKYFM